MRRFTNITAGFPSEKIFMVDNQQVFITPVIAKEA